jgi:uncharacterized protein (DUF305 family)
MPRHSALVLAGLAAAAVLSLASCTSGSSGDDGGADAKASGPPVVAPGRPGEAARTLSAEEAAKARPKNTPNAADVAYVQNMIKHHEQALEMTRLADKHAEDKDVRGIADRIHDAQGPEIEAMKGWLRTNDQPVEPEAGHDHATMPGMATPEQMADLGRARGEDFDERFLRLMIAHHEGALTMATDVLAQGNDILVEEMANDVISSQASEINRMRDM